MVASVRHSCCRCNKPIVATTRSQSLPRLGERDPSLTSAPIPGFRYPSGGVPVPRNAPRFVSTSRLIAEMPRALPSLTAAGAGRGQRLRRGPLGPVGSTRRNSTRPGALIAAGQSLVPFSQFRPARHDRMRRGAARYDSGTHLGTRRLAYRSRRYEIYTDRLYRHVPPPMGPNAPSISAQNCAGVPLSPIPAPFLTQGRQTQCRAILHSASDQRRAGAPGWLPHHRRYRSWPWYSCELSLLQWRVCG